MWLIGRAEAEVVQDEQRGVPLLCQVRQQFQSASHPEDALLAVLCEWEIDQQCQPQAQQAPAAAATTADRDGGFACPCFGKSLKKIVLKKENALNV